MHFSRRRHLLAALCTLPVLSACAPLVVAGGTAGVISAHDRRLTGAQADDETAEWKGRNRFPAQYKETAHVNFTAFNRVLLLTGEVPDDTARQMIGNVASQIEGIRLVYNELLVAPATSLSVRSNDVYVAAKFRARLLESGKVSVNHVKSVLERGTLFLLGIVSEEEAKAAVQLGRTTDGVGKVVSLFEVLPAAEIKRIDSALLSSAPR